MMQSAGEAMDCDFDDSNAHNTIGAIELFASDEHPFRDEPWYVQLAEQRPVLGEDRELLISGIQAIEQCVFLLWPSLVRWHDTDKQTLQGRNEIGPGWWIRTGEMSIWKIHAIRQEMNATQFRCGCFKWSCEHQRSP